MSAQLQDNYIEATFGTILPEDIAEELQNLALANGNKPFNRATDYCSTLSLYQGCRRGDSTTQAGGKGDGSEYYATGNDT